MDILICGTAATNSWPALFCVCENCAKARALGGKNIRSRAAYMLGERVRIDFGPDSNMHALNYGLAYEKLDHLLITHTHQDHCFPADLSHRRVSRSIVNKTLHVWGSEAVEKKMIGTLGEDWAKYFIQYHRIAAWERIDLGEGMSAIPIVATHAPGELAVNYRIETGGRAALIAHDTGWYSDVTWEYITNKPVNLAIIDCTGGQKDYRSHHLGCRPLLEMRDEMLKRNCLAADAKVVATHFSHEGGLFHEDLVRFFEPHGVIVAYDGLKLTI
ncbi:MAG TPA: MBL fold metallo-hydrolase [Planctomycetota bacterium]|nr:MBL fold metallo-hydrolase [Planctomycetota bacterium]